MGYEAKKYENLLGCEGFSNDLLNNHFKLYEGYVGNTNKVSDLLKEKEVGTPEFAELKRRFGWEFNGMRLHELYFGNMTSEESSIDEHYELYGKIDKEFGSFKKWEDDFKATGAMRGIGWVALVNDKVNERLFNVWLDEHNTGNLAGGNLLLVMDVFEHAFMLDYGLKRADYIDAFWKNINWGEVNKRF